MGVIIGIIWVIVSPIACATVASSKRRFSLGWGILGLLLGPFGILVIAALPMSHEGLKKCEKCAEYVQPEAIVCKHCGNQFNSNSVTRENVDPKKLEWIKDINL